MRRLALLIEYDGTRFAGWQSQTNASRKAVQGVLEHTLHRITGESVRVIASGRTDAGVHAAGQVAHAAVRTSIPAPELRRALNALLPAEVAVREVVEADPSFHAQRDAKRKHYRYTIWNHPVRPARTFRQVLWVPYRLNTARMRRAAACLVGRHDFKSFEGSARRAKQTVRTVDALTVRRIGSHIVIDIIADGFLYNMVRNIVGTLMEIGRGRMAPERMQDILAARDRRVAGPTARPSGLCLMSVEYARNIFGDGA